MILTVEVGRELATAMARTGASAEDVLLAALLAQGHHVPQQMKQVIRLRAVRTWLSRDTDSETLTAAGATLNDWLDVRTN